MTTKAKLELQVEGWREAASAWKETAAVALLQRNAAEAERDEARTALAAMTAERDALAKPKGMTIEPLREWTDGTMTGQVSAEAGMVVLHLRDHVGGMVVSLPIRRALCIAAAFEACAEEAAAQQGVEV